MNEAIKQLRAFFKSDTWYKACREEQPVLSDSGTVWNEEKTVGLDTKINLALDFEYKFNEMAHLYMKWRKEKGLTIADE